MPDSLRNPWFFVVALLLFAASIDLAAAHFVWHDMSCAFVRCVRVVP